MSRDDFDKLCRAITDNNSLRRLINKLTYQTGQDILGNRVVQNKVMNVVFKTGNTSSGGK